MNNRRGRCRLCLLCRRPSAFCLACPYLFNLFLFVLRFSLLMIAGLAVVLLCWVLGGWSCGCLACCRGCLLCLLVRCSALCCLLFITHCFIIWVWFCCAGCLYINKYCTLKEKKIYKRKEKPANGFKRWRGCFWCCGAVV